MLAQSLGSNNQQALALKQQIAIESLSILDKEMMQIRSQRRRAESELAARPRLVETVSDRVGEQVAQSVIDAAVENDPSVVALSRRLEEADFHLGQHKALLSKTARNPAADPLFSRLRNELREVRTDLSNRRQAVRPAIAKELCSQREAQDIYAASNLRRQLSVLQDLEKRIEGERHQLAVGAQTVNRRSMDLLSIQDEIQQAQAAAAKMGNEIQALEVELGAPHRVLNLEEAEAPATSDAGKRSLLIGLTSLATFLASLLGMTFLEFQARRVSQSNEIVIELGLRLIGTLPVISVRSQKRSLHRTRAVEKKLERAINQSIDMIRAMLVGVVKRQGPMVYTITSATAREGKTSISRHLAGSMARTGRKTILIDANVRRPSIHDFFDQPLAPGLCGILRGDRAVSDAIVPSSVPGLDIIPAGEADGSAIYSLSVGGIAPLLLELRERYDCVIIDTAPVLGDTDTLLIAPYTDGAILSVLTDVSRSAEITEAREKLTTIGVTVLGAVLSGDRANPYTRYNRYRDHRGHNVEPAAEPAPNNDEAPRA